MHLSCSPARDALIAIGVAASVPAAAPAQSVDARTSGDPATRQDIIVTAGRQEQYLSKVGEGISVVTGQQLDDRGTKSLSDYTALIPGLSIQSIGAPGWGWVEVRGISPQSVGATVATFVDEIPIGATSALSRSGEYTPDLEPSDLARVEVLKGPQGTLYGATSLGGVIKYVTKGPNLQTTEIGTTEELSFLNNGQPGTEMRAAISTPLVNDRLAVRISGFYRHDAGYIDQFGPGDIHRDNANYGNSWGFRGALRWQPVSDVTFDLVGSIENSHFHGFAVEDLDPLTLHPIFGGSYSAYRALNEEFRVRTDLIAATVTWRSKVGTLISASSFTIQKPAEIGDITEFYSPTLANQPQDPTALVSYLRPGAEIGSHLDRKVTQELRFNSNRLGAIEFIAGGFYQHEHLRDGADYRTFRPSGVPDLNAPPLGTAWRTGSLSEYAGFANISVYLTDHLDITGGVRHSHIDQVRDLQRYGPLFGGDSACGHQSFSENANTYLGGVRWRPGNSWTLYARAASGYRPGGGRSIPPGAPANFPITYQPDSIWSYEVGAKYRGLGGRLTLDADAYWINWKDIQTLVQVGRFTTDGNGGRARSRGAELQVSYEPRTGLVLSGNAAYTDARFTQTVPDAGVIAGQRIYYVPRWTATIAFDYSWKVNNRWRAHVGGDYDYKSSQLDLTYYVLPANVFGNLHIGAETEHLKINVYVKNLTNKRIFIGDSSGYYPEFPPFQPVVSQPREFGLSFSQKI